MNDNSHYISTGRFVFLIGVTVLMIGSVTAWNTQSTSARDTSVGSASDKVLSASTESHPTAPADKTVTTGNQTGTALPSEASELILVGVVLSSRENNSTAVIEYRARQHTYAIGEPVIHADLILQAVAEKEAILSFQYEQIRLPLQRGMATTTIPVDSRAPTSARIERDDRYISHGVLLKLTPVEDNGVLKGLAASPNGDSSRFLGLGLMSDDIITEINGVSMTNAEGIAQAPDFLNGVEPLQLSVLRQGELMTVFVEPAHALTHEQALPQ